MINGSAIVTEILISYYIYFLSSVAPIFISFVLGVGTHMVSAAAHCEFLGLYIVTIELVKCQRTSIF